MFFGGSKSGQDLKNKFDSTANHKVKAARHVDAKLKKRLVSLFLRIVHDR